MKTKEIFFHPLQQSEVYTLEPIWKLPEFVFYLCMVHFGLFSLFGCGLGLGGNIFCFLLIISFKVYAFSNK